jgi:hypothetical protein
MGPFVSRESAKSEKVERTIPLPDPLANATANVFPAFSPTVTSPIPFPPLSTLRIASYPAQYAPEKGTSR